MDLVDLTISWKRNPRSVSIFVFLFFVALVFSIVYAGDVIEQKNLFEKFIYALASYANKGHPRDGDIFFFMAFTLLILNIGVYKLFLSPLERSKKDIFIDPMAPFRQMALERKAGKFLRHYKRAKWITNKLEQNDSDSQYKSSGLAHLEKEIQMMQEIDPQSPLISEIRMGVYGGLKSSAGNTLLTSEIQKLQELERLQSSLREINYKRLFRKILILLPFLIILIILGCCLIERYLG